MTRIFSGSRLHDYNLFRFHVGLRGRSSNTKEWTRATSADMDSFATVLLEEKFLFVLECLNIWTAQEQDVQMFGTGD